MTDTERTLLELLKASLFQTEPRFPAQVDWNAVFEEARLQAVVALAAPAVPPQEAGKWQAYAQQVQAEYMRQLYEQSRLIQLFEANAIPLVILKGTAAAIYYPAPFRRSTGDVDVLVHPDRFEDAKKLMEENGYQFLRTGNRNYEYTKGGVLFELHFRFSLPNHDDFDIDSRLFGAMNRAVKREINHVSFPMLPEEENGLVLLSHMQQHIVRGRLELGIRQVLDWMMYVHAGLSDAAWKDHFCTLAREMGLESLAIAMTYLCKTRLGLPDEIAWCDQAADDELADKILRFVFDNGNFGEKKTDKTHEMETAAAKIKAGGLFSHLQDTGLKNWHAAQKYPFLRPFAWLYQLWRYIVHKRILKYFRGRNIREGYKRGIERAELIKKLGIK